MNKGLLIALCVLALNSHADTIQQLSTQQYALQQAQPPLQQQIKNTTRAVKRLKILLKQADSLATKEPILFLGQTYSPSSFQQQLQSLRQQLQQQQTLLEQSQQELELLNNRLDVMAWRIKILQASQGDSE